MKIGIPSETDEGKDSMRSGHFGHAPYFSIVTFDDDMNVIDLESVKNVDHDQVGCGGVIDFAIYNGVRQHLANHRVRNHGAVAKVVLVAFAHAANGHVEVSLAVRLAHAHPISSLRDAYSALLR